MATTTVSAKIYSHHGKADGTFNVKYVVYHQGERKLIDSPHFVPNGRFLRNLKSKTKFYSVGLMKHLETIEN